MEQTFELEYGNDYYTQHQIKGTLASQDWSNNEITRFSLSLKHENFVSCIFPVKDKSSFMHQISSHIPLDRYGTDKKPRLHCIMKFTPEKRYMEPMEFADLEVSEEKKDVFMVDWRENYFYVPDEFRALFRSMVKFVSDIHKMDKCTTGIKEPNLVISEGTLKFYNIGFQQATPALKDFDYASLASIIRRMLGKRLRQILNSRNKGNAQQSQQQENAFYTDFLGDMRSFLDLLTRENGDRSMIVDHVAIISHKRVCSFIREASDSRYALAPATFDYAVEQMVTNQDWIAKCGTNEVLHNFNLDWASKGKRKALDEDQNEDQKQQAAKGVVTNDTPKHKLVRFLRNAIVHAHNKDHTAKKELVVTDHYLAIIIANLFGTEVSSLQEMLAGSIVDDSRNQHHEKPYLSLLHY